MCRAEYEFESFQEVSIFFKRAINLCKQMNYSEFKSAQYKKYSEARLRIVGLTKHHCLCILAIHHATFQM